MPFQPFVTCWLPGNANPRVHDVVAGPLLVMLMATVAPVDQLLLTWYCTEHEPAAFAAVAPMTASAPTLSAAATASADRRRSAGPRGLVEGVVAMGLLKLIGAVRAFMPS